MNPHLEALQICPLCPPYALKSLTSVYESSSKLLRFNCLQKFFSLKTIYLKRVRLFSGGLPMMSDSLFSLIILVYVSVTFCIVFFLFCWKATNGRNGQLEFKQQCPLMTNEIRVNF